MNLVEPVGMVAGGSKRVSIASERVDGRFAYAIEIEGVGPINELEGRALAALIVAAAEEIERRKAAARR